MIHHIVQYDIMNAGATVLAALPRGTRRYVPMRRQCTIPDCDKPHWARGFCSKHYYQRWVKPRDQLLPRPPVEARFWSKVDKSGDCWLWMGSLTASGYGSFRGENRTVLSHRQAYELLVGCIPDDLTIDHLCRVRRCVNPTHMETVTNRINILRGNGISARAALRIHCPHGHPYDLFNTIRDNGCRRCRICREQQRRHRQETGAAAAASRRWYARRKQSQKCSPEISTASVGG